MSRPNYISKLDQFSDLNLELTDSVCALGELSDILSVEHPVYCLVKALHLRINSSHNALLSHFDSEFDEMYSFYLKMADNGRFEGSLASNVALLAGSSRFKSGVPSADKPHV